MPASRLWRIRLRILHRHRRCPDVMGLAVNRVGASGRAPGVGARHRRHGRPNYGKAQPDLLAWATSQSHGGLAKVGPPSAIALH